MIYKGQFQQDSHGDLVMIMNSVQLGDLTGLDSTEHRGDFINYESVTMNTGWLRKSIRLSEFIKIN